MLAVLRQKLRHASPSANSDVSPWPWPWPWGLVGPWFGPWSLTVHSPGLLHAQLAKISRRSRTDTPVTSHDDADIEVKPPPAKKRCGLFSHYRASASSSTTQTNETPQQQLIDYLCKINDENFDADLLPLSSLCGHYPLLQPLFESLFCIPASSAPVERVFSKSGLLMRPHRARMGDDTLEMLVFLACNNEK